MLSPDRQSAGCQELQMTAQCDKGKEWTEDVADSRRCPWTHYCTLTTDLVQLSGVYSDLHVIFLLYFIVINIALSSANIIIKIFCCMSCYCVAHASCFYCFLWSDMKRSIIFTLKLWRLVRYRRPATVNESLVRHCRLVVLFSSASDIALFPFCCCCLKQA